MHTHSNASHTRCKGNLTYCLSQTFLGHFKKEQKCNKRMHTEFHEQTWAVGW